MPYAPIQIDETNAESIQHTRMEINKELKTLKPGKAVLGMVGNPVIKEEHDEHEILSEKEKATKKAIQDLIIKYVEPPILSESHPNPAKDRVSFLRKVEKQTLGELRRFWKGKVPAELNEDEVAELNRKWTDLSP